MTNAKLPLTGIKVVEFAGLAPGPFTGLILADFGADVIRIDKVGAGINPDTLSRGKRSVAVNPKSRSGLRTLRKLIAEADVLIEPFRPGVMEKLGLGPEHVIGGKGEECTPNPGLVYARLTGFQRQGPYANMAGHDINYIALSGVLSMLGQAGGPPQPPANLLADFAGGSLICLTGILMALLARGNQKSGNGGKGQVVEADMVTGARYVATFQILMSYIRHPQWHLMFGKGDNATRGTGVLDGAAPWYGVYKTKDDLWMSVGAIEPQFYAELLRILKASVPNVPAGCPPHPSTEGQHDRDGWPTLRQYFTAIFAQRTRAEWTASFIGTDACTVPVLDRDEALIGDAPGSQGSSYVLPRITKNAEMVREGEEPVPPAPAPRLTATPARTVPGSAVALEAEGGDDESAQLLMTPGEHTIDVLKEWIGASDAQIKQLYQERAIGASDVPDDWDRSSKL